MTHKGGSGLWAARSLVGVVGLTLLMSSRLVGQGFPPLCDPLLPLTEYEVSLRGPRERVYHSLQRDAGASHGETKIGGPEVKLLKGTHWIDVKLGAEAGLLDRPPWSPDYCPGTRRLVLKHRVFFSFDRPVLVTTNLAGTHVGFVSVSVGADVTAGDTHFPVTVVAGSSFCTDINGYAKAIGSVTVYPQVIIVDQRVVAFASTVVPIGFCDYINANALASVELSRFGIVASDYTTCRITHSVSREVVDQDRPEAFLPPEVQGAAPDEIVWDGSASGMPSGFVWLSTHREQFVPPLRASGYRLIGRGGHKILGVILPGGNSTPLTVRVGGTDLGQFAAGSSVSFQERLGAGVEEFIVDGFENPEALEGHSYPSFQLDFRVPFGWSVEIQPRLIPEPFIAPLASDGVVQGSDFTLQGGAIPKVAVSYQWFFNSAPLQGETNQFLNLKKFGAVQNGQYSLSVSNEYGTRITPPVSLRTVAEPLLREFFGSGSNSPLILSWNRTNSVLETAPTPMGAWRAVPGAKHRYFVHRTNAAEFFRLVEP